MYYNKRKLIISSMWIVLGIVFIVLDIMGIATDSAFTAIGAAWIVVGALQIYKNEGVVICRIYFRTWFCSCKYCFILIGDYSICSDSFILYVLNTCCLLYCIPLSSEEVLKKAEDRLWAAVNLQIIFK